MLLKENQSPASENPLSWFVLYTRHQHEKTVAQQLIGKGLKILLPLYSTARRWKDRTKIVSSPLFPCYVFIEGGLEHRLEILKTPGVVSFVLTAGRPASVCREEIESIRLLSEARARFLPHPFMKCGERVKVKSGPLMGIEGILVRRKNIHRLVLSVTILGMAAAVEVDAFIVEPLSVTLPRVLSPAGPSRYQAESFELR
jgi:transcription antitermination factor NusG